MTKMHRNKEMMKLRQQGWTLKSIGKKFGVSAQAVHSVIGNTGEIHHKVRMDRIRKTVLSHPDKNNDQVSSIVGVSPSAVRRIRAGKQRYKLDSYSSATQRGIKWENWAICLLKSKGFDVTGLPYQQPFDLLVNGWRVDVKSCEQPLAAPSLHKYLSPKWSFHVGAIDKRADCDFYLCITGNKDVFVIPSGEVGDNKKLQFCYPTKRPEIGKYQRYHNAYHLLKG